MAEKSGRAPDYRVHALNKVTDAKNRVGAAWLNEDGTISMVLEDFITLPGGKDILVTLFPVERKA